MNRIIPPPWVAERLPRWPDMPTIPRIEPSPDLPPMPWGEVPWGSPEPSAPPTAEPITVAEFRLMVLARQVDQHMMAEAQAMSERPPRHRRPLGPAHPPTDPGDPPQDAPQPGGAKYDTP